VIYRGFIVKYYLLFIAWKITQDSRQQPVLHRRSVKVWKGVGARASVARTFFKLQSCQHSIRGVLMVS